MNTQSLRQFIANELNESLGNLNAITDSTMKRYVKQILKYRGYSGVSPDSEISREISCKHGDIIKVLKREASANGDIAAVVFKHDERNVGILVFDPDSEISASANVRVLGGYQGYDIGKRDGNKFLTLSNALKYFQENWTSGRLKQSDIKDNEVSIVIIYADREQLQKTQDRRYNKSNSDKYQSDYSYGSHGDTRFMKDAKQKAKEIRQQKLIDKNKNLSTKDPMLYAKLHDIHKTAARIAGGPEVTIDGVTYSDMFIDSRPTFKLVNNVPRITLGYFKDYSLVLSTNGVEIVKQ